MLRLVLTDNESDLIIESLYDSLETWRELRRQRPYSAEARRKVAEKIRKYSNLLIRLRAPACEHGVLDGDWCQFCARAQEYRVDGET